MVVVLSFKISIGSQCRTCMAAQAKSACDPLLVRLDTSGDLIARLCRVLSYHQKGMNHIIPIITKLEGGLCL